MCRRVTYIYFTPYQTWLTSPPYLTHNNLVYILNYKGYFRYMYFKRLYLMSHNIHSATVEGMCVEKLNLSVYLSIYTF